MRLLICGGAGYIGSHITKFAIESNQDVTVLDSLSTGNIESIKDAEFVNLDISDKASLIELFQTTNFDVVMHFSAFSSVSESITDPQKYYINNISGTLTLLSAMVECELNNFIFSSSAAVYGAPKSTPILESDHKQPINPYGRSKLIIENALSDYFQAYGISSVSLRYFNAAGADPSGIIGEKHEPETHLIPNILKSIASKSQMTLNIFGNDYPTPDGTCIRDYIHVNDLASAHLLAANYLSENPGAHAFNLGIGRGFSVMDVINATQSITGHEVEYKICDRRPGDPPILVADATAARRTLSWEPEYTTIESIIETAWNWHTNGEIFG